MTYEVHVARMMQSHVFVEACSAQEAREKAISKAHETIGVTDYDTLGDFFAFGIKV